MKVFSALAFILSFGGLITFAQIQKSELTNKAAENYSVERKHFSLAENKPAILVELFTAEGCAACPPAERVLAQLEKDQPVADAEIVTLALHVDYWNNSAWKDPFSAPLFSQRQMIYGQKFKISSIYTPQMIVSGTKQFIGNSLEEAKRAIAESAKSPKARIALVVAEGALKINVSEIPAHGDSSVFLAVAEDDLSTDIGGGENSGRVLKHTSVTRELKPVGRVLSADNNFETEIGLQLQPDWKTKNLKIIVFLQENQSRKILGTAKLLPDKR